MALYPMLMMIGSSYVQAILGARAGFGSVEILIALTAIVILIIRIGIPVAVIFLLYQWWKDKKNKSK